MERCIGVLKQTFRCLSKERAAFYKPTKATFIINACVVLHNKRVKARLLHSDTDYNESSNFESVSWEARTERDAQRGMELLGSIFRNYDFKNHLKKIETNIFAFFIKTTYEVKK